MKGRQGDMKNAMMVAFAVMAAAAGAAVVPISPAGGEKVALLPEAQRDVIAQPTYSNRLERLKERWLGARPGDAGSPWGRSCPLVLRWRVTDGEQGPWKIAVGKNKDLSDARVWLVPDIKPRLPGEKDRDQFGLELPDANLEVGATYHWCIWSNVKCTRSVSCGSTLAGPCKCGQGRAACASSVATFLTDSLPPRWIALEGRVKNVRDLGGWQTHDRRRVKQGMIFRGQGLNDDSVDGKTSGRNRLTEEDRVYLKETLKIRTDLDLRTPSEVAGMTKSPIGDGVAFIHHPSPAYAGLFSEDGRESDLSDEGKKTMAANFRIFCDERNYPIFFHCIGGTDRTGSLAYVLNAVLGVDRHDLEVDWESTLYPNRLPELLRNYSGQRGWRSKEYFDEGFAKYGDAKTSWNDRVVLYLLDCGITKEEIERFRSIMLETPSGGLPECFTLDTSALSVEVRRDTLALTVKDRRTGRVWETFMPKSRPPRYSVRTCEADNNQIRLEVTDVKTQDELSIVYRLDNKSPYEFTVTVSGSGPLSEPVIYPCPLAGRKGDMMILPLSEGFRLPMHEKTMVIWGPRMWESAMSMAFFGVEEDATGAGWMGIAETRNDARVEIFNADGKPVAIGPAWMPERGQYGYPRTMRYVFFDKGGYVAMAKRYRKTAEEQGLVKTFREKAKSRPSIDRLVGAANIWYFPTKGEPSPANMARELKAAGIDRFLWSQYASATNVAQITAMPGVLAGRYDCYRDIYPPDQDAKRRLGEMEADICRNSDAGRNAAIWNSADSNDLRKAWGYTGKDGKKHYCIAQCTLCQPANVRRHVAWELERIPFTSRFIDVATAIGAEECENPAHPMTRTQSRAAICEELRILGDEFGLVVGSEQGIDFAVPYCDYFEGMLCPSRCRMPHGRPGAHRPDIFREGLNPTNVTPEEISRVVTYNLGEKYRIPLFELVFHDCCCSHWWWYDYSNRPICFWEKRDLFNVLYGTAPMYIFDYKLWSERKEMFVKSYKRVCSVARRTGYGRMTDHRVLTPDRSVQRSEFADGTVVTVNFGAMPYRLEDGTELAPMDSNVTCR